jgi:hypothetical protein
MHMTSRSLTGSLRVGADEERRLVEAPASPDQRSLAVEFRSRDGRSWSAIGGGATVAAVISWARESCPDDVLWEAVSWKDLYGE